MSEISSSHWSEVAASNNQNPPNGAPEGQNAGSLNDCIREVMAQTKRLWGRLNGRYASTGSANAYVLTPDVALAAYQTGERYSFRANFANTGSATLNISGLGARAIKKMGASGKANLASGDIQSGQPVTVEYDGTDMVMVTPPSSGTDININGLTEDTSPDATADFLVTYDASASGVKKATPTSIVRSVVGDYFHAHKNGSDQGSIANAAETKVTFGTELADTASVYDTSTSRFTPPSGTRWLISASVNFTATGNDGQQVNAVLYKNGSAFKRGGRDTLSAGSTAHGADLPPVFVEGNGTDYYEIYALLSNATGSRTIEGNSDETWFQAVRIR